MAEEADENQTSEMTVFAISAFFIPEKLRIQELSPHLLSNNPIQFPEDLQAVYTSFPQEPCIDDLTHRATSTRAWRYLSSCW